MKPPFTYYGGKTGLAGDLVAMMPTHRVYIEPFFGSGAVLFAKAPSPHEIVNDIDHNVVTFFRVLREHPDELAYRCSLTPYARAEYRGADLDDDLDEIERARRFWVRVNQSFAKTAGRHTGFSVTTARTQASPASVAGRIDRFAAVARRLAQVTIESCDAAGLVERFGTADALVYADPPYLAATREGRSRRRRPDDYLCDMGGEDDHRRLAEVLRTTRAAVLLSGYPSALYEDLYGDWWQRDFHVNVHASNSVTARRGQRVERVWCNRALNEGRLDFAAVEGS